MQPDHSFANVIHKRGFRVTIQRLLILEALRDGHGHSSPEEICHRVSAKAPAINSATVYRNLNFLCEIKLVASAQIGGHLYYELAGSEPHHHLICHGCNRVLQVGQSAVKGLLDKIDRDYAFLIDMNHLTLFGLCADCRTTPNRVHPS